MGLEKPGLKFGLVEGGGGGGGRGEEGSEDLGTAAAIDRILSPGRAGAGHVGERYADKRCQWAFEEVEGSGKGF